MEERDAGPAWGLGGELGGRGQVGPSVGGPGESETCSLCSPRVRPPPVQLSLHFYRQIAEAGPEGVLEVGSAL